MSETTTMDIDSAASSGSPLTVLLSVYHGMGGRDLLRTDVLRTLLRAGARVVILSPNADEAYFKEEFDQPGVSLEKLDMEQLSSRFARSRIERTLRWMRRYTLGRGADLSTLNLWYGDYREQHRRTRWALDAAVFLLRRSRTLRRAVVAAEERLFVDRSHEAVFERHRPDVVVATTLGHAIYDSYLMRLARRRGSSVMSAVFSWDHTSKWGIGGARADRVAVWSDAAKSELVIGHDMPVERIAVVGVPHFDMYFRSRPAQSREQFLAAHDLAPDRATLFMGTRPPSADPQDTRIVDTICRAIAEDRLAKPCQVVVRLHPQSRGADGPKHRARFLEFLEETRSWCPYVSVNDPVILSEVLEADMPWSEMETLHAMLAYSDVLVNRFSTLNLEACVHDLPCVNAAFPDRPDRELRDGGGNTHNKRIRRLNFSRIAFTPEELITHINAYLESPELDREGRARVVSQECGFTDGRSGERVAREILRTRGAAKTV